MESGMQSNGIQREILDFVYGPMTDQIVEVVTDEVVTRGAILDFNYNVFLEKNINVEESNHNFVKLVAIPHLQQPDFKKHLIRSMPLSVKECIN